MSEKKPPRAMGQFSATNPADEVSPTIVGGQSRKEKKRTVQVPAGVERVLFLAATDAAFHEELMRDRAGAVDRLGIALSPSELAMLNAAPEDQLQASISRLDVSPGNLERRRFMQAVAVGAAAVVAGGCGDNDTKVDTRGPTMDGMTVDMPGGYDLTGIQPDFGPAVDTQGPTMDGMTVDMPGGDAPQDVEVPGPDYAAPAGIRPEDGSPE